MGTHKRVLIFQVDAGEVDIEFVVPGRRDSIRAGTGRLIEIKAVIRVHHAANGYFPHFHRIVIVGHAGIDNLRIRPRCEAAKQQRGCLYIRSHHLTKMRLIQKNENPQAIFYQQG